MGTRVNDAARKAAEEAAKKAAEEAKANANDDAKANDDDANNDARIVTGKQIGRAHV